MPTSTPFPLRIEKDLHDLLREGTRRTPHRKQELIRLTLRRHLRAVIEEEATVLQPGRITNVEPWPKGALIQAYRRVRREGWDDVEDSAVHAQGKPHYED